MGLQNKQQTAMELTSCMMHGHYCENNVEIIIGLLDDTFSWFGTGEEEYAVGKETVTEILRQFQGMVPKCNISDEVYDVIEITPEILLCTGRMWITTDPSVNIYLRVHQRVTTVFRDTEQGMRCCHIHISNPYMEMQEGDVGFPTQIGQQSYEYLQECILEQKKQIEVQTVLLERLSFEDSLTGLYNRNKFNQKIAQYQGEGKTRLGVACLDLNGLKCINDQLGHSAGDAIICSAAQQMKDVFPQNAYRIGGDEFVVIDEISDEGQFHTAILTVYERMLAKNISISVGLCWREEQCNIQEQFDEADRLMYEEKARFYHDQKHDRRKQREIQQTEG